MSRQVRRLGALGAHVASGIESEAAERAEAAQRRAAGAEWAERRAQEASSEREAYEVDVQPGPVHQEHLRNSVHAASTFPPAPHTAGPIVVISSYTQFSDLAHGPRGEEATRAMRSYRLSLVDGSLTLLSVVEEGTMHNPAFSRRHPSLNVLYACTESVQQEGQVIALEIDGRTGALVEHCPAASAGGTSTCYLTIHKDARRMLLVNYWDSTICTMEMLPDGRLGALLSTYDPKNGQEMKASADGHVNHSRNDAAAQAERQGDPHSHAIVLEPSSGHIAYVPDLGMDVVRQFYFDEESGVMTPCGEIVSGMKTEGQALGPRYIAFSKRPGDNMCYVVNELSSEVAVFEFSAEAEAEIRMAVSSCATAEERTAALADSRPTLVLLQTVSTIPDAFPRDMNTCGRVTIHPTGDFVVTSNRSVCCLPALCLCLSLSLSFSLSPNCTAADFQCGLHTAVTTR